MSRKRGLSAAVAVAFAMMGLPMAAMAQSGMGLEAFQPPHKPAGPAKLGSPSCAPGSTINAAGASVCGIVSPSAGSVFAYEGIRYGTAARWAAPQPVALSSQNAVAFGSVCPQSKAKVFEGAEDCLFVNVWAPASAIQGGGAKLPVMVFIHGGAFMVGEGSSGLYDGSAAAAQGVIVVTLNYRLGALGFLAASGSLNGGTAIGGNFGLMDQQLALKWVNANIGYFGGDNTQITLFGESAGAMSTALHTFDVPSSAPLFSRAIMESNPAGVVYRTPVQSEPQGDKFLTYMCKNYAPPKVKALRLAYCKKNPSWLAGLQPADIVTGQTAFMPTGAPLLVDLMEGVFGLQSLPWQPVVDGQLVIGQPFNGYAAHMPAKTLGMGTNLDEGTVFTAMGYSKLPALFSNLAYKKLIKTKFSGYASTIMANPRYNGSQAPSSTNAAFENANSEAFANLMTDYAFTCGNLSAANQALGQGGAVYTYQFAQPTFFDLYNMAAASPAPDNNACQPIPTANPKAAKANPSYVCHANELPYVFSTLGFITSNSTFTANPNDQPLAGAMNTAWVNFAKGQTTAATGWTAYAAGAGGTSTLWNYGSQQGYQTVGLDAFANCSALWLKTAPYAPAGQTKVAKGAGKPSR